MPPERAAAARLPSLLRGARLPAPAAARGAARGTRRRAPPGAAAARLRGAAGASPGAQAAQARAQGRSRPSRSPTRRSSRARFLAALPFALTRAQARALRGGRRATSPAARRWRGCCRAMSAAARRSWRRRRRRAPPAAAAGRADGAHRAAGRAALAQLRATGSSPLGETVALLSGSQPARTRRRARSRRSPRATVRIVVGTHALFQEGIEFAQPGARHRRRAAPLRRAAAPAAAGEGPASRAACRTS